MDTGGVLNMDWPSVDIICEGTIKVDKQIQHKIFEEFNTQYRDIAKLGGEPKFCIMNKIAYQQFYAWHIEHNSYLIPETIESIPIVLDWTSDKLLKLKMGAFDEWKLLDIEDMES